MESTASQGRPLFIMMILLIRFMKHPLLEASICKTTHHITLGTTGNPMMMELSTKQSTGIILQPSSKVLWHSFGIGFLLQEDSLGQVLFIHQILILMSQKQLWQAQSNITKPWEISMQLLSNSKSFKPAIFQSFGDPFTRQAENGFGGEQKGAHLLSLYIASSTRELQITTISTIWFGFGVLLSLTGILATTESTWLALTVILAITTMIANTPCLGNLTKLFKEWRWLKWQRMAPFPIFRPA